MVDQEESAWEIVNWENDVFVYVLKQCSQANKVRIPRNTRKGNNLISFVFSLITGQVEFYVLPSLTLYIEGFQSQIVIPLSCF